MKTYIHIKDIKMSVFNVQQILLSFYNCIITHKNFKTLMKKKFKDCYERVCS